MIKNKLLYENSLDRFLVAQESCYQEVVRELKEGRKKTHWIWFIFPQLQGLGQSEYSQYYGFRSEHCSVESILGVLDAKKLQSSLTLFDYAIPNSPLLRNALNQLFGGAKDWITIDILVRPIS